MPGRRQDWRRCCAINFVSGKEVWRWLLTPLPRCGYSRIQTSSWFRPVWLRSLFLTRKRPLRQQASQSPGSTTDPGSFFHRFQSGPKRGAPLTINSWPSAALVAWPATGNGARMTTKYERRVTMLWQLMNVPATAGTREVDVERWHPIRQHLITGRAMSRPFRKMTGDA